MSVVWFDQQTTTQCVGGKGFRLCRLAQEGFPVLPGCCIPVEEMQTVGRSDIECALKHMDATSVAVRSSAVGEDGPDASFAGVCLTRLNLTTPEGVQAALKEIGDSASTPAAMAYLKRHGIHQPLRMAAIIQKFIMPEAAGVLFLRDPFDFSEHIIVEASWGLGEAVVGGSVTPDRWVLWPDGTIVSSAIADKDVAVVAAEEGTRMVQVAPELQSIPCLTPETLCRLAALGRRCEQLFHGPQDIEWAVESDTIWLLQTRPITASRGLRPAESL